MFTLPVPEMPGPGRLQAGRKILIPVEQGGLKNRYCAGGPGSPADPGGAPWEEVFGVHLAGSDAALPPKVAAFFAPVFGKAVRGKDNIRRLNRSGQRTVWGRQPCRASGLCDCLPQCPPLQREGAVLYPQTRCPHPDLAGPREALGKECV